jgi:hypothetical protein
MLKKSLIALGVVIIAFLAYVAVQPSHYTVSREIVINASPEAIFPYINDCKKMEEWSPWKDIDPESKMSHEGPEAGVGSKTFWDGGKKLGTGSATIIESIPNKSVKTQLVYTKPQAMSQVSEITLQAEDKQTRVRWSVSGENSYTGRLFCFFMNMDKMVGGIFEKGLAKLKLKVEA